MQASQPLMHVASCLVCPTVDDQKSVTHTRTCVQAAGFVVAFAAGRPAGMPHTTGRITAGLPEMSVSSRPQRPQLPHPFHQ
jgi:hypothetical protein